MPSRSQGPPDPNKKHEKWAPIPCGDVALLRSVGHLIDASFGGLLVGPSHAEGGIIYVLEMDGSCSITTMEGHEYLVNSNAADAHREELHRINDEQWDLGQGGPFTPFEVPSHILKLDASENHIILGRKWLYMSDRGQFVVNRHSTAKYLHRLDEINRAVR